MYSTHNLLCVLLSSGIISILFFKLILIFSKSGFLVISLFEGHLRHVAHYEFYLLFNHYMKINACGLGTQVTKERPRLRCFEEQRNGVTRHVLLPHRWLPPPRPPVPTPPQECFPGSRGEGGTQRKPFSPHGDGV